MLWVSTFSGFLPSLTSSSVVWARPENGHEPMKITSSSNLFMLALPLLDLSLFRCREGGTSGQCQRNQLRRLTAAAYGDDDELLAVDLVCHRQTRLIRGQPQF